MSKPLAVRLWAPCALIAFAPALLGQTSEYEGRNIVGIQYSPAPTLAPADLARAQPLHVGEPLQASEVAAAIDSMFATGRFEDIQVQAESSGNGVIVRFVLTPAWFVGGVNVEGKVASPPNRGQVAANAGFTLGTPFHDEDVKQAQESIQKLLVANGLYDGTVRPEVERDNDGQQVFLTFTVHEGKRAKYEMPSISGDTKLSDNTIVRATGWRLRFINWWRQVTDSRTRNGIAGILNTYGKKDYLAAKVELQKLDYDEQHRRVKPVLNIKSGPKIKIRTQGAKVSKRKLKKYVPVYEEEAVDRDLLVEGARNLRDYFQSQGYYDVGVEWRHTPVQNGEMTIDYIIERGSRYKLVKVDIEGNTYFKDEDLRERMFLTPAGFITERHGRYSEAFRKKDEQNITALYQANGFHDCKVTSTVIHDYKGKPGDIAVTMHVAPGPQWVVDNLAINGVRQLPKEQVAAGLSSIVGQPFSDVNMATDRNQILTLYYSSGFPKATFQAAWRPSDAPHHVNIVYNVTEGDRQYVRDVITSGIKTTRQSLIDRQITLNAGDPLSPVKETDIQKAFYDLGIFARVDTAIQNPDGAEDHKYVLYNFEEANRYHLTLGVGAQIGRFGTPSSTSLASAAGSTGFSPEFSLNVSRLNFLGLGHVVTLRGNYSNLQKLASFDYLAPRFRNVDGRNITFTLLYDNELSVQTFASRREQASIQISQNFSKSFHALFRYTYRRDTVQNVIIPVLLVPQFLAPDNVALVETDLIQDRRDNPADPHRGIWNTANIGLAGRFFGSQRNFSKVLLRNATYYNITRNTVFARQTQFGVISPFSVPAGYLPSQYIPLPERFFSGGADSIRAFPFNQAGPRDIGAPLTPGGPASAPTGFPLGGNALFINNLEWRFPFMGPNIQGVLFHDMGNVFTDLSHMTFRFTQRNDQDFNYMVQAAGFGIRYRTPVGPIRVDLAYSINPPSFVGFKGTPFELLQCTPGSTASFCQPVHQSVSHFQFFFSIGQTF
ncbi:MAG TPA: POTRA domain-containing protein [Bryobacteraceae bacterium]|nr:POTRA domain-containing protein [Bryobacteraceae bacterium]